MIRSCIPARFWIFPPFSISSLAPFIHALCFTLVNVNFSTAVLLTPFFASCRTHSCTTNEWTLSPYLAHPSPPLPLSSPLFSFL
ncbi:hypothetical protein EDB86DRAFT_2974705 [Lactarius hatsudake]|nr:hypothetical protein EDB86DRAFT_2974705 [Lactarius hatsudake]